jgi:signal transduction histidine kinase
MPSGSAAAQESRAPAAPDGRPPLDVTPPPVASPAQPSGLGTRRRLLLSFAALAGTFALAFGSLLLGLGRMEQRLAYLHEHEDQMRVVLDLGDAIRRRYSEASLHPGSEASVAARQRVSRERVEALLSRLVAEVDEDEPARWVADTALTVRRLELLSNARAGDDVAAVSEESIALAFRVEGNLDRVFAFLRDEAVVQSGAVGELRRRTLHLAIAFVVGALVLAAVLAAHLSRSIAAPLAVLGAGAARLGRGDLDTRIALPSGDEFGALAAEFNGMAASLKQHHEELVRSEKLAGLGRVAAGIAHELNNPLQVMLGYVSLDRDRVKGEVALHLARIEREARRCKDIVDALLQLARPAIAFVPVPVDVREVAEEVADAVRIALGERAPAVSVTGDARALGTRARFRQILFNLARNGAEAAGPGGAVRLELSAEGRSATISVTDTGPGIPAAVVDRIFEPFFTTRPDGTGLGLAIARALAASLDGELELDRAGGPGARFTVRVPGVPAGDLRPREAE